MVSPFLRKVKTASGATAVQIAVKEGRRDKVIEHLGSAHTEAELAALMEIGRHRIAPDQLALELTPTPPAVPGLPTASDAVGTDAVVASKRSALLWEVLHEAYTRLGLGEAVGGDRAFEQMVLARLVEPSSKAQVPRVLGDLGLEPVSARTLFRSLARAQERSYRESLSGALFEHVTAGGGLALCLYDVTTLYFKTEHEDDLRRVGYSKDRRVDPQIIVGLLVDRAGFPLQVGCFRGQPGRDHHDHPHRGGLPGRPRHRRARGGRRAPACSRPPTWWPWTTLGCGSSSGPDRSAPPGIWMPTSTGPETPPPTGRSSTPSPPEEGQGASATSAVVMSRCGTRTLIRARGGRCGHTPSAARPGTARPSRPRPTGPGPSVAGEKQPRRTRFVTVHQGDQVLDEASIARARSLVGLKGYVTNIPAHLMDAGEVVSSYHELWHIEQSFRMSKHDLRARPVFHHTHDAIEAHLTMVMASLAVARYLQDTTGISIARIVRELRSLQEVTINLNGHHLAAAPRLTDTANDILTALSTPPPAH